MLPELGVSLPFPGVLSSLQAPCTRMRKRTFVVAGTAEETPLQALLQEAGNPAYPAELVGVATINDDSSAFIRSRAAGLSPVLLGDGCFAAAMEPDSDFLFVGGAPPQEGTPLKGAAADKVSSNKAALTSRFTQELERTLADNQVDLLVLLDDVDASLLSREFVARWAGKMLVVHASLLPAFAGPRPVEAALEAGVRITGCTVCFAVPSAGGVAQWPQVLQETVRIEVNDTSESLRERLVSKCERRALVDALQLVASESVALRSVEAGGYRLEQKST
eukprot:gnl/TRDRNA2_/TRDRNA2_160237_c1_seq1.p1 gnl/TRDRNA2_/TRDRNA2_160237_c1~~gnl/TRDRNA2_/TRDRNA2_160237_c1_seq1.p1  ORF type:complete len:305 (+),score=60.05 gnl/TRDRNA2_/TRDRNA2_160237_c1_seq1:85-915(+)